MAGDEEVQRLRKELDELEKRYERETRWLRLCKKAFLMWRLPSRIAEYREAASVENPLPHPQTENLLATLLNRSLIGTMLTIVVSVGTIAVLVAQTFVLSRQADILDKQFHANVVVESKTEIRRAFDEVISTLDCQKMDADFAEVMAALLVLEHQLLNEDYPEGRREKLIGAEKSRIDGVIVNNCGIDGVTEAKYLDAFHKWVNSIEASVRKEGRSW